MGKCMSRNIPKENSLEAAGTSPQKSKTYVPGGTKASHSAIAWKHSPEICSARSNVKRSSCQNRPNKSILNTSKFLTKSARSNRSAILLQKSYSTKNSVHTVGFPNNYEIAEAAHICWPHTYRRSSSTKEASRLSRRSFSIDELSDRSHWLYYDRTPKVSSENQINPRILISPRQSEASDCSMPKTSVSNIDAAVDCDSTLTLFGSPSHIRFDDLNIDLAVGMKLSNYSSFSSLDAYDPPVSLESSPASNDILDCKPASEKFLSETLLKVSEPVKMKWLSEKLSPAKCNNDNMDDASTETQKDYSVCVELTAEPVRLQESFSTNSPDQHILPINYLESPKSSSKKYAVLQPIFPVRKHRGLNSVSYFSTAPDLEKSTACLSSQNQKENIHCSLIQNCQKPLSTKREALREKSFLNYSLSNNDVLHCSSSSPEKNESHSNMPDESCFFMQSFNSTRKTLEKPEKQVLLNKKIKKLETGIGACSAAELLDVHKHTKSDLLSGLGDNKDVSEALGDNKVDAELLGCLNSISVVDNFLYSNLNKQAASLLKPIDSKAEKDFSEKITLPPSVSKALSIMEAVAELSSSTFPKFHQIHTKPKKVFSKVSTEISSPEAPENSASANEAITLKLNARQNEITLSDAKQTSRNTDMEHQLRLNSIPFPVVLETLDCKPRSVKETALRFACMENLDLTSHTSLEIDAPSVVYETMPEISYSAYATNCCQGSTKTVPGVELISKSSLDDVSNINLNPHSSRIQTNPISPIISFTLNQSLEKRVGVADSIIKGSSSSEQDALKSRLATLRYKVPVDINAKESHEASGHDASTPRCMYSNILSVNASKQIPLPHEDQKAVSVADIFKGNIFSEPSADETDIPSGSSRNSWSITSPTTKLMSAKASKLPAALITQTSSITFSGEEIAEIWRTFEAGQTVKFE